MKNGKVAGAATAWTGLLPALRARAWLCGTLLAGLSVLALSWPGRTAEGPTPAPDAMSLSQVR